MSASHQFVSENLFFKLLDMLSLAVFIVRAEGELAYSNAMADSMLQRQAIFVLSDGKLKIAKRDPAARQFSDTVVQKTGEQNGSSNWTAVPLTAETGERAVAYIIRIEEGFAAVFVTGFHCDNRMAIDVLKPLFDLTPTEAVVAYATSRGDSPETISNSLGNTIATVRSHLKVIYSKAEVSNKTALAARVSAFMPPVVLA